MGQKTKPRRRKEREEKKKEEPRISLIPSLVYKFDGCLNVGMQTLVDRAVAACGFQFCAVGGRQTTRLVGRNCDRDAQGPDATDWLLNHFLFDMGFRAGDVQRVSLGDDTHDGQNTTSQCGANQIGR